LKTPNKRRGTKTSSFGTSGRISHDSTAFYASKLYEDLPHEKKVKYTENIVPPEFLNKILCKPFESQDFNFYIFFKLHKQVVYNFIYVCFYFKNFLKI